MNSRSQEDQQVVRGEELEEGEELIRRKKGLSRLRPSIAESILEKPQFKSNNIFTTKTRLPSAAASSELSHHPAAAKTDQVNPLQLPLSIPSITTPLSLAMASDAHHHHHHPSEPQTESMMSHCSMNMVFNSQPIGTCIVFKEFYISGTMALIFYLTLLFILSIGYEYLRLASIRYERMIKIKLSTASILKKPPSSRSLRSPSSSSPPRVSSSDQLIEASSKFTTAWGQMTVPRSIQLTRSLFYVSNVALSFFLMLVVMTYNAQIIVAVLAGAFVGHFIFHREISTGEVDKGMACH